MSLLGVVLDVNQLADDDNEQDGGEHGRSPGGERSSLGSGVGCVKQVSRTLKFRGEKLTVLFLLELVGCPVGISEASGMGGLGLHVIAFGQLSDLPGSAGVN